MRRGLNAGISSISSWGGTLRISAAAIFRSGLFLFTVRNGQPGRSQRKAQDLRGEADDREGVGQVTPLHFHWNKMEDIINRGGGNLVIRLWNSTADEKPARSSVTVAMDGVQVKVKAGGAITLKPGASYPAARSSPVPHHSKDHARRRGEPCQRQPH